MSSDEAPVTWRKSSYSQNGDCVEVAYDRACVLVRDSKDPSGRTLKIPFGDWAAFIAQVKSGGPYYIPTDDH
jgi:hypothetical protein